jgi:hypothetical protein
VRQATKIALLMVAAHYTFSLQSALACSRAYGPPVKVKSAFVVVVHDPTGGPLPNMEVRAYEAIRKSGAVSAHVELAAIAITGKDGKAAIGLTQDDYTLAATGNGISSGVVQIQVYDDSPSGVSEVSLTWPGGPITAIQSVSGVFGAGKEKDPRPGLEVSLKNASSGNIAKVMTDASGHFMFREVSPGFYALHVSDPRPSVGSLSKLEGDIAIQVTPDATNGELPRWGLVMSSCGLSAYKDANSMIIFSP